MASLTIRNLEESLKGRLRVRAASRGRSMEEEARHILRAALSESSTPAPDLGQRIRQRFGALGDVKLPLAAREPVREPPIANDKSVARRRQTSKTAPAARPRRRA